MVLGPPTSQYQAPYSVGAISMKHGTPSFVRRIRTPGVNDVLSGRGGSVNQHPGNIQFREWVNERKYDYNLALSKNDKALICREVIAKVLAQNPPGKFLGREESSTNTSSTSSWWVELDDERVMSKTSQALREGAPKIREEHQHHQTNEDNSKQQRSSKRRRSANSRSSKPAVSINAARMVENISQPYQVLPLQPVTSDKESTSQTKTRITAVPNGQAGTHSTNQFALPQSKQHFRPSTIYSSAVPKTQNLRLDDYYSNPAYDPIYSSKMATEATNKNNQNDAAQSGIAISMDYNGKTILATDETPPLHSMPAPSNDKMESFKLESATSILPVEEIGHEGNQNKRGIFPNPKKGLKRNHSLASSELGEWSNGSDEFINPFQSEEEEEQLFMTLKSPTLSTMAAPRLGVFRDTSVSSKGDLAGIGALMRKNSATGNVMTDTSLFSNQNSVAAASQAEQQQKRVRSLDTNSVLDDDNKDKSRIWDDSSVTSEPNLWDEEKIANTVPEIPPLDASWSMVGYFHETSDTFPAPVSP